MPKPLSLAEFLAAAGPILDVRSPGEFEQAHIPGAMSFPLFSNEERAVVGTCYKQKGRGHAVELGLEIVGPKLAGFAKRAKKLAVDRQVRVHCWRGGMRSGSMAWLLRTAGLEVSVLAGGYKAFRRWCLQQLESPRTVVLLGGMTGSGKTYILQELTDRGEQTIDLEGLANHRGSSYGALGLPDQPSTEQFENKLALEWQQLDPDRRVWLEAESRNVGCCRIPPGVFAQMDAAPVFRVQRSRQERIETIAEMYGEEDLDGLIAATQRLKKRLGSERTQQAIAHLEQGEIVEAIDLILPYYDKAYTYDLERRDSTSIEVDIVGMTLAESSEALVKQADRVLP
ncbi:MAG: tRNA 2-selenouridine(34) synthase MnmH [Cyanobacteria bacterium P01_E01_bin.45]